MADFFTINWNFLVNFLSLFIILTFASEDNKVDDERNFSINDFVFWPNATVPFYVDPEHYDQEQTLSIMTTLSLFSFKTCLKFVPVPARPKDNEHVLLIENPKGVRKCTLNTDGHSIDEPHIITLGYECLRTPDIEMMIMNALGFPFEHNRAIRDVYIVVQQENVEPGYIELFTMEFKLPLELRALPYDVNSVLHFDTRAFSKNGHRTIIFKDHRTRQMRIGLSDTDLRKVQIVYGPECLKRDRQEKIDLCQGYPGVARKKREIDQSEKKDEIKDDIEKKVSDDDKKDIIIPDATANLRVNRDITPPPNLTVSDDVTKALKDLGIEQEVQAVVDQVNKVSALALKNARGKYCNISKSDLRSNEEVKKDIDILQIVGTVAEYATIMVDHAIANLSEFCETSKSPNIYFRQRGKCPFFDKTRCVKTNYRSTKSGPVKYSTQHRPIIKQSTKHYGSHNAAKGQFDSQYRRSANGTDTNTQRKKRDVAQIQDQQQDVVIDEFYRKKRRANNDPKDLTEAVEDVNRWKREVDNADAISTTASVDTVATTEKVEDSKTTEASSIATTKLDEKETETSTISKQETVEEEATTKPGLRMRNTHIPMVRNVKYAPKRRNNDEEEQRPITNDLQSTIPTEVNTTYHEPTTEATEKATEGQSKKKIKKSLKKTKKTKSKKLKAKKLKSHKNSSKILSEVTRQNEKNPERRRGSRELTIPPDQENSDDKKSSEETIHKDQRKKSSEETVDKEEKKKSSEETIDREESTTIPADKVVDESKLSTNDEMPTVAVNRAKKGKRSKKKATKAVPKEPKVADDPTSADKERALDKSEVERDDRKKIVPNRLLLDLTDKYGSSEGKKRSKPKKEVVEQEEEIDEGLKIVKMSKKNKEFYRERRWPRGELYYMIQGGELTYDINDVRRRLAEVKAILDERTCVKMQEIRPSETNKFEDYLVLDGSPDYVTGRVGGRQPFGVVELLRGGQHRQHAAMVVMAMLGFYFEVARHDRDKFIRVHLRHVRPDKLHHFEKIRSDATFDLPYDYKSATHPAWQFWRQIGRTGISTVATYKHHDPDGSLMKTLGQNEQLLSELDLVKINSVYGMQCFSEGRRFSNTTSRNFRRSSKKQKKNSKKKNRTATSTTKQETEEITTKHFVATTGGLEK